MVNLAACCPLHPQKRPYISAKEPYISPEKPYNFLQIGCIHIQFF